MKRAFVWFFSHSVWTGIAGLCALIALIAPLSERDGTNSNKGDDVEATENGVADKDKPENGTKDSEDNFVTKNSTESNHVSEKTKVFAVFEEQEFELCGYNKVTARIIRTPGSDQKIKIRSMDKRIPNRPFRGYERIVRAEENIELWPDCHVALKIENLPNTTRIVISHQRR